MSTPIIKRQFSHLTAISFVDFPIFHAFFNRHGGKSSEPYVSLNTACVTKDEHALENRQILFKNIGIENKQIYILSPSHGDNIVFVDNENNAQQSSILVKTDAAFTNKKEIFFLLSTADCIPAIFSDYAHSFVGIVHLGWRNLVADFTKQVINQLINQYEIELAEVIVGIGPSIYPCCYIFNNPVQKSDPFWQPFLKNQGDENYAIDLPSTFKAQLQQNGISPKNIFETGICTSCHNDAFFSCYREGYVSGRFPTVVGLTLSD